MQPPGRRSIIAVTLDRNLANARIYPAINITESGTRKEENSSTRAAPSPPREPSAATSSNMPPTQAMKYLVEALGKHPTNESLFKTMKA